MDRPKAIIQAWVEAFILESKWFEYNRGSAEELAEFYHEDAINYQVTQEPILVKQQAILYLDIFKIITHKS